MAGCPVKQFTSVAGDFVPPGLAVAQHSRGCDRRLCPIPTWTPDIVMVGAGRPPTTFLRPTLQAVDGGLRPTGVMTGCRARLRPFRLGGRSAAIHALRCLYRQKS